MPRHFVARNEHGSSTTLRSLEVDGKTAETVYDQWLSILTPDGKISVKDMQEYFDLAYSQNRFRADQCCRGDGLSLLEQVLAENNKDVWRLASRV
jgi:hypothetical protein